MEGSSETGGAHGSMGKTLVFLLLVILVIVSAGSYWYYERQIEAIQNERYRDLAQIADLKSGQLVNWRRERRGDAGLWAAVNTPLVSEWMAERDDEALLSEVEVTLEAIRSHYDYASAFLATSEEVLLVAGRDSYVDGSLRELMARGASRGGAVIGEFFREAETGAIYLDVLAPVVDSRGEIVAFLVLRSDPDQFLYPLIQSWPNATETAETLLIRREEDSVLFLNDLRHQRDAALNLAIPMDSREVPAVRAALGETGIFEGTDYRGEQVLTDIRKIPESPWFMVAKIDTREIFAEAHYRGRLILLFGLGLILLTGTMFLTFFSLRQRDLFSKLLETERMRSAALEEIRATLYGIGDGVISTDAEGRVVRMNPVAEALTGWSEEEAAGKEIEKVFRIINEESLEEVENPVRRVIQEGRVVGLANHTILVSREGIKRPIADSGAPITTEEGTSGAVLVFRDQSAERAAEKALRDSERRFRIAIREAPFPLLIYAEDGEVIAISRAWEEITGYSRQEIADLENWVEKAYGERKEAVLRAIESNFELQERKAEGEFEVRCADGSTRVWDFHSISLGRLSDGRKLAMSMAADATQRKEIEGQLERRIEVLETIFDNVPVLLCFLDQQGEIQLVNREFNRVFGWTSDEIRSHPNIFEMLFPDVEEREEASDFVKSGQARFRHLRPRNRSGRTLDVSMATVTLSDGTIIAIGLDVTEQKRAESEKERMEAELLQAQKMEALGKLTGGIAHDFNNMLTVILLLSQSAQSSLEGDSSLERDLTEIHEAASQAAELTRQLLSFSRKQPVRPEVLDLNEVVATHINFLRRMIREEVELAFSSGLEEWKISADRAHIGQVLTNLVVNSSDAIESRGKITIETRNVELDDTLPEYYDHEPGDYVLLSVSDDGKGMSRETIDQIFDPFFTTKEEGEGTGLGLSIVFGIVRQNDGFIRVYSEPGHGSTFHVYFPRATGDADPEIDVSVREASTPATEAVLVVEDQEPVLKVVIKILESEGYTVYGARRPSEALKILQENADGLDLLVTDVVMPEMSGPELRSEIRKRLPHMKTIFMSGYTSDLLDQKGDLEEEDGFILKPFSKRRFLQQVREVLER